MANSLSGLNYTNPFAPPPQPGPTLLNSFEQGSAVVQNLQDQAYQASRRRQQLEDYQRQQDLHALLDPLKQKEEEYRVKSMAPLLDLDGKDPAASLPGWQRRELRLS